MEIRDNRNIKTVEFKNIKEGDIFGYDNIIFLKTSSTYSYDEDLLNCYNLQDNEFSYFNDDECVIMLKGELIINN